MVMVNPSFATVATDPLRNFKFEVTFQAGNGLTGLDKIGFMSVSGLNITTEVIPYREGGFNTTTQKMPGQSDFAPITLSRGLAVGDNGLMNWMKRIFSVTQGAGGGGAGQEFRIYVDIAVKAHPWTSDNNPPTKAIFRLYNAWPTAIAYSDLDAGANAIVVQQLTLAHEGFDVRVANDGGTGGVTF